MENLKNYLPKIVFLDSGTFSTQVDLSELYSLGDFSIYQHTSEGDIISRIKDAEIIITNKVKLTQIELENASNCKLICVAATGMNNIDLDYAKIRNIEVKNVTNYGAKSVAQHTLALVLSFTNKIREYSRFTSEGSWCKSLHFTSHAFEIHELAGKTWGIIGLGAIGSEVMKRAQALDCKVIYHSTSGVNLNQKIDHCSLDDLLKQSDIISIHAPLTDRTKNLLNKQNLIFLKKNAILVNVSRGGIINEKDLYEVMKENTFYVGLDVLEDEPMLKDSYGFKLSQLENVIITPHVAWASIAAQVRLIETVINSIKSYLK